MPNMPTRSGPRTWPLTDDEQALTVEAWEFGASSLLKVNRRYPKYADEIASEFAWQVCTDIHKWDRRRLLYFWSLFRLKRAISAVFRGQTGGERSREAQAGIKLFSINGFDDARPGKRDYESVLDEIAEGHPKRTQQIIRLAAHGYTKKTEIAAMIGIDHTNVFRHLKRAKANG